MGRNLAYRGLDENIAQLKIKTEMHSVFGFNFVLLNL